jgi:hypothetical protein
MKRISRLNLPNLPRYYGHDKLKFVSYDITRIHNSEDLKIINLAFKAPIMVV